MRKLLGFILCILILSTACTKTAQRASNEYKLTGTITGCPDGILLFQYSQGREVITLDSITIKNGQFVSMKAVPKAEVCYLLVNAEKRQFIRVAMDTAEITLSANIDSLDQARITGSPNQEVLDQSVKLSKAFNEDSITKEEFEAQFMALAKQYPSSRLVLETLERTGIYAMDGNALQNACDVLSPAFKEDAGFVKLQDYAKVLQRLAPGSPAPEFKIPNTKGKLVALDSFKGKYVIVDFWASWCGPCRRANPHVLELYKKYIKTKKFDIIGVSLDSKKADWLKAIADDNLPWTQLSNLQSWQDPVVADYGIKGIPHTVIIDPQGKLVGTYAPNELDAALAAIFKM